MIPKTTSPDSAPMMAYLSFSGNSLNFIAFAFGKRLGEPITTCDGLPLTANRGRSWEDILDRE